MTSAYCNYCTIIKCAGANKTQITYLCATNVKCNQHAPESAMQLKEHHFSVIITIYITGPCESSLFLISATSFKTRFGEIHVQPRFAQYFLLSYRD